MEIKNNWYNELCEDLKGLEFSLIIQKWKIGQRITREIYKFQRGEYGTKTLDNLAEDLKVSTSHLYHCINFYKKFPNYNTVIKLKCYSWRYIVHNLLPEHPREKKEVKKINTFIVKKLEKWKKGDIKDKTKIEKDCEDKIKIYKSLLNSIEELKEN